ncbi:O-methylsterigmatocystin oxidoreductase [Colletotrichum spinosum]|uniref:O-methylsterigmatocystin oxidoreductase n=1 Tax=Colletotrichum spinosum TaxID=1347390 RepID=A0A4R8Q965_9PEZI|nr:O-methylsterigmatocystin oxidoreductase [Colletotrichum spinosum]
MTQHPDVQAKAQAEIDRVVGTGRLPVISDRDNLPYVEAIVKETLRWHTVLPLCVPHTREEETTYGGYRIPGGALILPNVWSFTHDSSIYRDPEVFRPERHLSIESNQPEMDPRKFVFGFGRRVCPGRVFAENTLFLDFAQSLAVFNFEKPIVNGQVMEQKLDSMPGTISHVGAYETRIRPRSAQHEGMVRSLEKKYPWQNSDRGTLNRLRIPAVVMPV